MKGRLKTMKIKKLFKKSAALVSSAIFALSMNVNAVRPTAEELQSFCVPFVENRIIHDISKYPAIGYYAGLYVLRQDIRRLEIPTHLRTIHDAIHALCNYVTTSTTNDTRDQRQNLENFYEDLRRVRAERDFHAVEDFIARWDRIIRNECDLNGNNLLQYANDRGADFRNLLITLEHNVSEFLER